MHHVAEALLALGGADADALHLRAHDFDVELSGPSEREVTAKWDTADGTGADLTADDAEGHGTAKAGVEAFTTAKTSGSRSTQARASWAGVTPFAPAMSRTAGCSSSRPWSTGE